MKQFREFGSLVDKVDDFISINVAMQSYNKTNPYSPEGFLNWRIPLEEFDRVCRDFGGSYSPCHYENGYRLDSEAKVGSVNSIMLDFDDGLTLADAAYMFGDYEGVIATTKSHQKDKNGTVCDRFRVILPTDSPITLNASEYKDLMVQVMKKYPQADKSCKNISRFYFMTKDSKVIRLQGDKLFDWKHYHNNALLDKESAVKISQIKSIKPKDMNPLLEAETKADWYRQHKNTQKLLDVLNHDTKFVTGQRNNTLYSWTRHLQDVGLNDSEVIEIMEFLNAQRDSVPDKELTLIFRSCGLAL